MKSYNRLLVEIILLLIIFITAANICLSSILDSRSRRDYQVEINRLYMEIKENGLDAIRLNDYIYVKNISVLDEGSDPGQFFEGNDSDYAIRYINGDYYRFDYQINFSKNYIKIILTVNICLAFMALAVIGILIFLRIRLVKPFHNIKEVPFELSRGNLSVGLKESRNKFFNRFVWGLNMLREHLESQKTKELALLREKKMLILTLSHDIKTPLSAIKLYAKALMKNLYDSEEKRMEIAASIEAKANEIEGYVAEIVKASREDFLNLEIKKSEFYLKDLLDNINSYYREKLELLKIEFDIASYSNCLLSGDLDRAVEVLQNIIENSIKYGDGRYIHIQIDSEENCRLITVTNSGNTLSENEMPHMFDSFWRGSNAGGNNGSGLGLYICRQLMKKMDGDIYALATGNEMRLTAVFRMP